MSIEVPRQCCTVKAGSSGCVLPILGRQTGGIEMGETVIMERRKNGEEK